MTKEAIGQEAADKPGFWQPGFGNDWLENFYELPGLVEPGVWQLLSLSSRACLILGLLLVLVLVRRWHLRRLQQGLDVYRQQALDELADIRRGLESSEASFDVERLRAAPQLLRRAVLSFSPRDEIAQLNGQAWCDFLLGVLPVQYRSAPLAFEVDDILALSAWVYMAPHHLAHANRKDTSGLLDKLEFWLKHHEPGLMSEYLFSYSPVSMSSAKESGA